MNIEQTHKEANELMDKVGDVLHDQNLRTVHLVLARLFVTLSMEATSDKQEYMNLCSNLWDAIVEEIAEEPKH